MAAKSPSKNAESNGSKTAAQPLLELDGLSISYHSRAGIVPAHVLEIFSHYI